MKPGRELDLLIAQKVFGFDDVHIRCPQCQRGQEHVAELMLPHSQPVKCRCDEPEPVGADTYTCDWRFRGCPHYSTELAAAMEVLNRMITNGFCTMIFGKTAGFGRTFSEAQHKSVVGETGTHAICLAALNATEAA